MAHGESFEIKSDSPAASALLLRRGRFMETFKIFSGSFLLPVEISDCFWGYPFDWWEIEIFSLSGEPTVAHDVQVFRPDT